MDEPTHAPPAAGIARARAQGYLDVDHIPEIQSRYVVGRSHRKGNQQLLAAEYGVSARDIQDAALGKRCSAVEQGTTCPRTGKIVRGLCDMHSQRLRHHGAVDKPRRPRERELDAAASATTNECIIVLYRGERLSVRFQGKTMLASRAVWIIANGDPGDGVEVLHTCNGGSGAHGCINIRHLRTGTHAENMSDMATAGRNDGGTAVGETNGNHRLTASDVYAIREAYAVGDVTYAVLATRFGVTEGTIAHVVTRRTWRHLPEQRKADQV